MNRRVRRDLPHRASNVDVALASIAVARDSLADAYPPRASFLADQALMYLARARQTLLALSKVGQEPTAPPPPPTPPPPPSAC